MGAGGGGFFMFYARPADRRAVYAALIERGLRPLRFRFDSGGARIVANLRQILIGAAAEGHALPVHRPLPGGGGRRRAIRRRARSPRSSGTGRCAPAPPTCCFGASIWLGRAVPGAARHHAALHLDFDFKATVVLQASAALATLAMVLHGVRRLAVTAVIGQFALYALGEHLRDSNFELAALYLMWCGLLLGLHALFAAPPAARRRAASADGRQAALVRAPGRVIFLGTVALAAVVTNFVFERVIYNGDEVA